jgi:hypothetical protein
MAPKHNDPKVSGSGKGKMTVVMFQLEGNDETLRDAIKVLGHGIDKLSPGAPVYKLIQAPPGGGGNGALPAGAEEEESLDAGVLDSGELDTDDSSLQSNSGNKPRKKYISKAIVAVKDIDWDSDISWRNYAAQKKPEGNPSRFVAVAGWFKSQRSVDVITPGHIVAAFDVMDWQKPENIPNTFAVLKGKRSGELFNKGEKANEWVLSQRGVNALDRLGKEKSK